MCFHKISASFVAITVAVLPFAAGAQAIETKTGELNVTITIAADCAVTGSTAVDFGSVGVLTAAATASGSVSVACTETTPYQIGLDAGAGANATTTTRYMTSANGQIAYQLFRDNARTSNWGNIRDTDTQGSTGTGAAQTFPVYGRVAAQSTPAPGTYSDVVTISVTY